MHSYFQQTVGSGNPLARFAHHSRQRRAVRLACRLLQPGEAFLDYGCGTGAFLQAMAAAGHGEGQGYEPHMREPVPGAQIAHTLAELPPHQVKLVTLFETIEHLDELETEAFLATCRHVLVDDGAILFSAPIEIGPALLLKEFNRTLLRSESREYGLWEFLLAVAGIRPGRRTANLKGSHKGFDFRQALAFLRARGWVVVVLGYGPLPLGTWYGNSQVYWVARPAHP